MAFRNLTEAGCHFGGVVGTAGWQEPFTSLKESFHLCIPLRWWFTRGIMISETVAALTKSYVRFECWALVRKSLPNAPFGFMSIKPSPARAALLASIMRTNEVIQREIEKYPRAYYIDIFHAMLDAKGQPLRALFLDVPKQTDPPLAEPVTS
jgi:hypothetical protein